MRSTLLMLVLLVAACGDPSLGPERLYSPDGDWYGTFADSAHVHLRLSEGDNHVVSSFAYWEGVGEFGVSGKNSKSGITLNLGTAGTLQGVFTESTTLKATVNGNMPITLFECCSGWD